MIESENFEIQAAFKITGQGRVGADGLAIWYTAQQGTLGPVSFIFLLHYREYQSFFTSNSLFFLFPC